MRVPAKIKTIIEIISSRIAYKLTVVLAVCFLFFALVVGVMVYSLASRLHDDARDSVLVKASWMSESALSDNGWIWLISGQEEKLGQRSSIFMDDPDLVYIVFYGQQGSPIHRGFKGELTDQDFQFEALSPEGIAVSELTSIQGVEVVDVVRPITREETAGREAGPGESSEILGWVRFGFSADSIDKNTNAAGRVWLWVMILILVFFLLLIYFLRSMISTPIVEIALQAERVGRGDLRARFHTDKTDEIGTLAQSFNTMVDSINRQMEQSGGLVDSLTSNIDQLSHTISEIYAISAQQSSGATEQAASVYEASSTSKEIAASASRIAETAEEVASNARLTSSASDQGKVELASAIYQVRDVSEKVEGVANSMVELGEKSQKISRIIDLINEISEQTNLLSLNAAIEAAGAGEGGKRFSVVAQEIRRLANRTLEATQVVRELVQDIQSATNTTVMVTEQSMKSSREAANIIENMDQSFMNIMEMVEATMKASTEITLSTRQQTTACEQMVTTVMEVSEVAAEVEKGAKETESALARLGEIAQALKKLAQGWDSQNL